MRSFGSVDLQNSLEVVHEAARQEPVLLVNHGTPSLVLMAVEEFRRLKSAAGEAFPPETLDRRIEARNGLPPDPLGYDTSDLMKCALEMSEAALAGRNREAVREEIERVERRLGKAPSP